MKRRAVFGCVLLTAVFGLVLAGLISDGTLAHAQAEASADAKTKLHALVDELTPGQQEAVYQMIVQFRQGPSKAARREMDPFSRFKQRFSSYIKAANDGDIDGMMAFYSEDFDSPRFGDKDGYRDFLSSAADMGMLDGLEGNTDDASLELLSDGTGSISGIEISGPFGSITIDLEGKFVDGEWETTGIDIIGI